jgi:ABC-2 type transport system ATP-binding protein
LPGAVHIERLSYRYGQRIALHELSFCVDAGQIVALLGPNGSGKTTLFRILSTIMPPQDGLAQVFDCNVADQRDAVRKLLGVVFQNPSLDKELTAAENLRYHGHLYGLRGGELASRVKDLLGRVKLLDRADERVKTFSGGMRRRVEIAKGLMNRPRLLLLDEPSTGLDPVARAEVWRTLSEVRQRDGVTVLMTTHLMDEADRCDRVAILDAGRLVADGSPTALKEQLGGEVVTLTARDLPAAEALLRERLHITQIDTAGATLRFERARAHELVPALMEALGGMVETVSVGRPTLEDVFIRSTGHAFAPDGSKELTDSID